MKGDKEIGMPEFFYRWEREEVPEWGEWRFAWANIPVGVKIFLPAHLEKPVEIMDKYNPRMEWLHNIPDEKEIRGWIELPSLYHVPRRGKLFGVADWKNMEPCRYVVMDHEWLHIETTEGGDSKSRFMSMDNFYIENTLPRKEWMQKIVLPGWQKSPGVFNSMLLGEWATMEKQLLNFVVTDRTAIEFWKLMAEDKRRCRFTAVERELWMRDGLIKILMDSSCEAMEEEILFVLLRLFEKHGEWDRTILYPYFLSIVFDEKRNHDRELMAMPIGIWMRKESVMNHEARYLFCRFLLKDVFFRKFPGAIMKTIMRTMMRLREKPWIHCLLNEMLVMVKSKAMRDVSETGDILCSRENRDYVPSSSGLVVFPDNPKWYLVNVRKVNYRIQENGSYISIVNGAITPHYNGMTRNEFYLMDRETLEPVSPVRPMKEEISLRREEERAIMGLEDVRLMPDVEGGGVDFYGITREFSYTSAIRIIRGTYDIKKGVFCDTTVFRPPYEENSCEKNWSWCGKNRYIYRWHPIEIGSIGDQDRLVIDERIETPLFFNEFRGSSAGIMWKGYMWFSLHSVSFIEGRRKYIHYLIVLDMDRKKVVGVTLPFCFEDIQIEYSIGLDIYKGRVLMLYSTRDSTSKYVRFPLHHALENFCFLDPHVNKSTFYQHIYTHE